MKNTLSSRALTLLTGIALVAAARTAGARLTVGDLAPKLQVAQWVQGDPVKAFDPNHVYVVEFWATWYGPCRAAIPQLNELHEKLKDQGIVVIGQDVWEKDDGNVAAFVKNMGDQMTYRIALDDRSRDTNGIMADTWLKAADLNGIPTVFVINQQGRIAWIGHPGELNAEILGQILTGTFDLAGFGIKYEEQRVVEKQRVALYQTLRDAMREKNWDAADAAVSELEQTVPEQMRFTYGNTRLQILLGRNDYDAACKLAESLSDEHKVNANFQNELAWSLVAQEGLDPHGLQVAEKIAERANSIIPDRFSAILDTLARIQFRLGKKSEAIATEQKAVKVAVDENEKRYLTGALVDYQQGKLPAMKE